jgi:hypothetical protein
MIWCAPWKLALGFDEKLMFFDVETGETSEVSIGKRVMGCTVHPSGLAVLTMGEVLLVRDGAISARFAIPWAPPHLQTMERASNRLLIAGADPDGRAPRLLSLDPTDGTLDVLYNERVQSVSRIAVSASNRWVVGAKTGTGFRAEPLRAFLPSSMQ